MQTDSCNLNDCFLCTHCMPEWKEVIAVKKQIIRFKRGSSLFTEGEAVKGMYFLYSGAVKITQQWDDNKELILRFGKKGDVTGHRSLGDAVYRVSAVTLEDTVACFISNELLESIFATNQQFTYKMMQLYARDLQKAEKRMRNLALMDVKSRIAETLLYMQSFFGANKDGYISVTVTRQDIASYAGTTYETVFKVFTELTGEGVISTEGKNIRIDRQEILQRYLAQ